MKPIGRPKGSGNTVIGLKSKAPANSKKSQTLKRKLPSSDRTTDFELPTKKIKFVDKKKGEQGVLIATWLTTEQIGKKKITLGDIIQDMHTFNRLIHKAINLQFIKNYVDKKTFNYIEDEVDRLAKKPYVCRKCHKNLNGIQIMCHGCLDWYHGKCINITNTKDIEYFCDDC